MEFLIPIIIVPALFLMIGWVVYVVVDGIRRRQQLRLATEFHARVLDRIGSAKEFGEFLTTSGGAKFLDSLTIEREGGPHGRILSALQTGLVFLALGLGLFILLGVRSGMFQAEGADAMATFATIATSLGLGLVLSAGASYGLSKRMGLMDDGQGRGSLGSMHSA